MNTFKSHFSLVIALVTMLLSIQSFITISRFVDDYRTSLKNDYALIVISERELKIENLKRLSPFIDHFELIDPSDAVGSLKTNLSSANYSLLQTMLPKFYRVHLTRYPSSDELRSIERRLKSNANIRDVESFASNQTKLYTLLSINRTIMLIFAILAFTITSLLVLRQMEVWRLRHHDRMKIMAVFGAPMWMRSAVLYKLAIIDSIISTAIVSGGFYYLASGRFIDAYLTKLGLGPLRFHTLEDGMVLFGTALFISVLSVFFVVMSSDEDV